MPVTELATLEVLPPNTLYTHPLPEYSKLGASRQSSWSGFPVLFYTGINNPSILYLISGWKDVEAHREWMRSPGNQEVMELLQPYITVKGLAHLEIDFGGFPVDDEGILVVSKDEPYNGARKAPKWAKEGVDLEVETGPKYYLGLYDECALDRQVEGGTVNFLKKVQDL